VNISVSLARLVTQIAQVLSQVCPERCSRNWEPIHRSDDLSWTPFILRWKAVNSPSNDVIAFLDRCCQVCVLDISRKDIQTVKSSSEEEQPY
jgi:hypothetical protein